MDTSNHGHELGIKMIDRDHAEISCMVLELKLWLADGKPWSLTGALLQNLARATASHFVLEEAMMGAAQYPRLPFHCLSHQLMIEQMRALTARSRKDGFLGNEPLLDLLAESHFAHVQNEDLSFGLWLNSTPRSSGFHSMRG
jgi:hemerythrin-like metal-binding protein